MLLKMFILMKMWYTDAEFCYAVFSYVCTIFATVDSTGKQKKAACVSVTENKRDSL